MTIVDTDILATIANGTGCGLVIIDEAGMIEYWSSQLEGVSGYSAEQVLGQPWSELALPSGFSGVEVGDDFGASLVDASTALSGIAFYPVGEGVDGQVKRVGVLRLTSQYADNGEGFPFAVETAVGIPSRRAMFELLQSQLACQDRYQTPFALLFLRIKNYRAFIEVLGAESWEITNRAIFDQLGAIIRMADSVGLYDEATFWVVLANSALDGTNVAAEKIKRLASAMKIDALDLFLSVAVAGVLARPGDDCEALVQRGLSLVTKTFDSPSGLVVEG
ncbi:diguanylate cyclase [bacterium]|nr:diguanylate cyclase [bacterium]